MMFLQIALGESVTRSSIQHLSASMEYKKFTLSCCNVGWLIQKIGFVTAIHYFMLLKEKRKLVSPT
jgi:hypothetical protein